MGDVQAVRRKKALVPRGRAGPEATSSTLQVGPVDDRYEREADHVAAQVVQRLTGHDGAAESGAQPVSGTYLDRAQSAARSVVQRDPTQTQTQTQTGGTQTSGGGTTVSGPTPTLPTTVSRFEYLTYFMDVAAPSPGDTGQFETSIKLPLDPSGSTFLQLDVAGEAERGKGSMKVGLDVAVGYGGQIKLFGLSVEAVAKLGGFIKAEAGSSIEVAKLLSYGLYRHFRESSMIPIEVTDYLWGKGGKTGTSAYMEAEEWGAGVEDEIFGDPNSNAYVTLGLHGGGSAQHENTDSEFKVGGMAKYMGGTKYSRESLSTSGTGGASQLGKAGKEKATTGLAAFTNWASWGYLDRASQKSVGEMQNTLSAKAGIGWGSLEGEAALEAGLFKDLGDYELKISAKGELSAAERKPAAMAEKVVGLVMQVSSLYAYLRDSGKSNTRTAMAVGEMIDSLALFQSEYEAKRGALADGLVGKIGGKGTRSVKVEISQQVQGGSMKRGLSISYISDVKVEKVEFLGVEAAGTVGRDRKVVVMEWPP